jgi:hypothetical protein
MNEQPLPVTMTIRRPDGTYEQVQIGTAVQTPEGFALRLGELIVKPEAAPPEADLGAGTNAQGFIDDLEYYANRARKKLADPSKARWHESERVLLRALEAEMARKRRHN